MCKEYDYTRRGMNRSWVTGVALAIAMAGSAAAQEASERELEQVRDEIAKLERDIERNVRRRDDGVTELRDLELSIAAIQAELTSIDASIDSRTERQAEIAAEQADARRQLGGEQAALAEQARLSYMTGRQEALRLVLSQEDPADFARIMSYYDYLSRHRAGKIAAVDTRISRLAELALDNEAVRLELERLRAEQSAEAQRLADEQQERTAAIAAIEAEIDESGSRIERMRAQEAELADVVDRLNDILEGFPVNSEAPFSAQRGSLVWPVEGQLAAEFGDARDPNGQIEWDGALISAAAGATVRAPYHGHVAVAQWTAHMGMLLIIDHGDGYLSLYGHNRVLLRSVGDWVRAGDAIAEVGDTGGQVGPALYFGIRKDAEPVDPALWVN